MSLSGSNPMLGFISPRYFASILGESFVFLSCLGVLLFAFDAHTRDQTERIGEVIYCKPISDLEWWAGRLLGLIIVAGVPILLLLAVFIVYCLVSEIFPIPFGEPIEPWSMVSLVMFDLIPNLVFFGSLTLFLAVLLKSRLLALIISLLCLRGLIWITSRLPVSLGELFQTVTGNVVIPSELVPTLTTPEILFNRIALIAISCGLLLFVCVAFPRSVPDRAAYKLGGIGSIATGVVVFLAMFGLHSLERGHIARWVEVHNAYFDAVIFPDVHHLDGKVDIRPGRTMTMDFTLQVSIPESTDGQEFVAFSFNPGFRITHLSVAEEAIEGEVFRHGLLRIPKKYFSSSVVDLQVQARGRPDQRFAYLDTVDRVASVAGPSVSQLRLLGTENFIFRSNFVVLVPGIKWYPIAGTATREDDWVHRRKDFFTVDLEVVVPRDWVVAGPSKRRLSTQSPRAVYHFERSNPLPELALVGSNFEVSMMEIDGIEFELLYSNLHRRAVEQLGKNIANIRQKIQSELTMLRSKGFELPSETVSMVEVPSVLRVYGGGRRMDTSMFPPGMMMVRENSLPTMNVASLVTATHLDQEHLPEYAGVEAASLLALYFTKHPNYESNATHYLRNLAVHQTSATGERAVSMNSVLELVVPQLLMDGEAYFDFNIAINPNIVNKRKLSLLDIVNSYFLLNLKPEYQTDIQRRERTLTSASVMSAVETVSEDWADRSTRSPVTVRAIRLRAKAFIELVFDLLGEEAISASLVELIHRHRGTNFNYSDFFTVLNTEDSNIANSLGDWFSSTKLPGFDASLLAHPKLISPDTDNPIFEVEILLRNGEPVTGPVRIWNAESERVRSLGPKVPIFLEGDSAKEVVLRSNYPIQYVWIEPYLSLNRDSLRVDVSSERPNEDLDRRGRGRRSTTIHAIKDLSPDQAPIEEHAFDSSIVIDDLDEGFSVPQKFRIPSVIDWVRVVFDDTDEQELDRGLPVFEIFPLFPTQGKWERKTDPTAYGKYRRTFAISREMWGGDQAFAKFTATLPKTGRWQLEYFLAKGVFEEVFEFQSMRRTEAWDLRVSPVDLMIENANWIETETLRPNDTEFGWRVVGQYDFTQTDVSVLVSNKPHKNFDAVIADAIRWTPVEETK